MRHLWNQCKCLMPATLLLAVNVAGCASVDVLTLSDQTFPPRTNNIEALEDYPDRSYIQIAELSADSVWLSLASKRQKILEKAATLGADAVVFQAPKLLQEPHNAHWATEQSDPAHSSPSSTLDQQPVDNVQPSARPVPLDTDVKIVLIHGGGHGGGHGGSHGHWSGHSGGWSRHGHLRSWGPLYSPYYGSPYGAYGFYGPGGWGYPPYCGPSAPCWYRAYPGSGAPFMNQVVIGTAIRYTDSLAIYRSWQLPGS
jgi:hypothetical protein